MLISWHGLYIWEISLEHMFQVGRENPTERKTVLMKTYIKLPFDQNRRALLRFVLRRSVAYFSKLYCIKEYVRMYSKFVQWLKACHVLDK